MHYDVFNGDADGIIALLQLRLKSPKNTKLITGVKRDIQLLKQVEATAQDSVTVLDISMAKNADALRNVLESGASVFYADHHQAGEIPQHAQLEAHIDLDANACTALIIDRYLHGEYHLWAITAAYGDNMIARADQLAMQAGLTEIQCEQLKALGTLINYNGYGEQLDDLHYHPAELYQALLVYASPFDVIKDPKSPYSTLKQAYEDDLNQALACQPYFQNAALSVFCLPNSKASRRISGVYGNLLANQHPESAHAVVTDNADDTYTVSLRAPLTNKQGAGALCSEFTTGGGREAAAGINALPKSQLDEFIQRVANYYA
ncbi:DHH family phosphoesterase [Vibrio sp. AK197]